MIMVLTKTPTLDTMSCTPPKLMLRNGALQYGDPEDGGYCVPPGGGFQAPAADDHGDDK
jgi:hypothetical protein